MGFHTGISANSDRGRSPMPLILGSFLPSVLRAISSPAAPLSKYVITKQKSGHWSSLCTVAYREDKIETSAVKVSWSSAQMLD